MDWWEPLNLTCERTHAGFWAEPLNAWTNAAFPLAALLLTPMVLRLSRRLRRPIWELWLLNSVLVLIGVGSFCYHTYAVRWAEVFDVGAIFLWVICFMALSLWRIVGWPWWGTAIAILIFTVGSPASGIVLGYFVWAYTPTIIVGVGIGIYAQRQGRSGGRLMVGAMAVFMLSIAAVCLDKPLCDVFPIGTHFIWHLLNSVALSMATIAFSRMMQTTRITLADASTSDQL